MTYSELINIWSRNINSEYIIPDLYELSRDNLIIPKEDLKFDNNKAKLTFVSGRDTYKMKIKKVVR